MASYTYRNKNTGDEVTLDKRSARLDALDNWEQTAGPKRQSRQTPPPPPANPPAVPTGGGEGGGQGGQ